MEKFEVMGHGNLIIQNRNSIENSSSGFGITWSRTRLWYDTRKHPGKPYGAINRVKHQFSERILDSAYALALLVRQWQRYLIRPVELGVRTLIVYKDQVLLVRHRAGLPEWILPGGGVQRGETLAEAARREAREEAGCDVRVEYLLGMFYHLTTSLSNHTAVFVCTALEQPRSPQGDLEIIAGRLFDMQQSIPEVDVGTARRIAEYVRGEAGMYREW
jgi:8-oxo-dGTP pyrophosphatase MutT (NUDIX family)